MRAAGAHRAPARRPAWLDAPGKRFGLARLGVIAALVIYTVLVLGGSTARNIPFPESDAAMSRAPGIETLFRMDANTFQERFGATPDGLEGWMLFGGNSVMEVSELLVAKSTDSDALNRLEDAVSARLDDQQNSFRNYGTNQIDLLEHAIVLRRGPYLFYGVSESVEAWEDRFLGLVR